MMITLIPFRPSSRRTLRRAVAGAVFAVATLAASAVPSAPWDEVSIGLFNEAHAIFVEIGKSDAPDHHRISRFGEAVTLLNAQPRTQSNIEKANGILGEIVSAKSDDDIGLESRYLQGRIEQVQRSTPDLAKADAIFADLIQRHPTHPAAQRAQVKLAVVRLYAKLDPAERKRRYDAFSTAAASLTEIGPKVALHLLLGEFAQRFDYGNEAELAHLVAADKAGIARRTLRVQVLVRIGDLARLTGRKDVAIDYYSRFLVEFPRTDRRSTVEAYIADLKSSK